MGFYRRCIVPFMIDRSMNDRRLTAYRREVAGAAEGRVLEIGFGSGHNLVHYQDGVSTLIGLEPEARLLRLAVDRVGRDSRRFEPVRAGAEALPFESASFDTVVSSFTMCSIPALAAALAEVRRVLRPGGRLLFVEHGRSADDGVRRWQDRLDPLWVRFSGGCHMNRPIDVAIGDAGFAFDSLRSEYLAGAPRLLGYLFAGSAKPR